ncbi:hypothetical protein CYMTET_44162 [Cymbomonas tetramitiformis]|uniref:Uncharacterized protein n=1 Tax=Cymbomonas tetramitiformis TaxID=36881 RepID=A0AAE0C0U2_9CHLO|nr:hypothetical protein CYMTET_44162 [Cymbomonas tetramitiformis]
MNTGFDEEEQMALEAVKLTALKKKINAKGWSNHMEDIMKAWGEKAASNREMHDTAASKWKRFSDRIYIPVIFLSTIAGVSNFGAASIEDNAYWMSKKYVDWIVFIFFWYRVLDVDWIVFIVFWYRVLDVDWIVFIVFWYRIPGVDWDIIWNWILDVDWDIIWNWILDIDWDIIDWVIFFGY